MNDDEQQDLTPDPEDCFTMTLSALAENLLVMDELACELQAVKKENGS